MRFNIKTIFVDDYSQVAEIIRTVERRYRRRTIFVSGSAADYGPWGRAPTESFLMRLASALINKDYRITSGFGLEWRLRGNWRSMQMYSTRARSIEEQLVSNHSIGIADVAQRGYLIAMAKS